MGKGDKKTAKGKRFKGSYGVSRMRKNGNGVYVPKRPVKAKDVEPVIEELDTVVEVTGKEESKPKKPTATKTASKKPVKKAAVKKTSKTKKGGK